MGWESHEEENQFVYECVFVFLILQKSTYSSFNNLFSSSQIVSLPLIIPINPYSVLLRFWLFVSYDEFDEVLWSHILIQSFVVKLIYVFPVRIHN